MSSNQFDLSDPPQDAISSLHFSPYSSKLLASSWDRNIYLYEIESSSEGKLLQKHEHRAPVLDACFGKDDNEIYTAGLDWDVTRIDLESGNKTVVSSHKAAVKSVAYSESTQLLISASWDCTFHVHSLENPENPPVIVSLPSKPFAMSLTADKVVIGMANRHIFIYDLNVLSKLTTQPPSDEPLQIEPWQRRESSMKFMTRAIACMPLGLGYATSSIEGRVSVEWFDPSPESQSRKYAFKCHREAVDGVDVIYPVNSLAYHPVHKTTFASGGGDGTVALWDGATKRRIRQYQKFNSSIAALAFSEDGKYLAVAFSPGFEDGKEDLDGPVGISVRELTENEAKGKGAK